MPRTFHEFWSYKIFRYWIVIAPFWVAGIGAQFLDDKDIPSMWRGCEEVRGMAIVETGEAVTEADIAQCEVEWREWRNAKLFRMTWPFLAFPGVLGVIWLQSRRRRRKDASES